jgi:hypothetical protein
MPSLEAKLEGLLAEVKGLDEALNDEVQERRRDHDKLTELLTRYENMGKLFDGFIQERTYDRGKINAIRVKVDELIHKVEGLVTWRNEREISKKNMKAATDLDFKEKRKMRWDLIVALVVGLLCAIAGVTFERLAFKEKKEPVEQKAPAPKQP